MRKKKSKQKHALIKIVNKLQESSFHGSSHTQDWTFRTQNESSNFERNIQIKANRGQNRNVSFCTVTHLEPGHNHM